MGKRVECGKKRFNWRGLVPQHSNFRKKERVKQGDHGSGNRKRRPKPWKSMQHRRKELPDERFERPRAHQNQWTDKPQTRWRVSEKKLDSGIEPQTYETAEIGKDHEATERSARIRDQRLPRQQGKFVQTNSRLDRIYDGVSPLPKDYRFLPSGDVYMTRNCRRESLAAGRPVYAVKSPDSQTGIYIPASILAAVRTSANATKASRANAVEGNDARLVIKAKTIMRSAFPGMPSIDEARILARAFEKKSGRVGRSTKLPMEKIVDNAVEAHIRHMHTEYDRIIGTKGKQYARNQVKDEIDSVRGGWRRCLS